jgi:hypothetical protein
MGSRRVGAKAGAGLSVIASPVEMIVAGRSSRRAGLARVGQTATEFAGPDLEFDLPAGGNRRRGAGLGSALPATISDIHLAYALYARERPDLQRNVT